MSSQLSQWRKSIQRTAGKITSSKLVMFYLGFSLLYCAVQSALSTRAFLDNVGPTDTLNEITNQGNARNFTIPLYNATQLALCASSHDAQNYTCNVVWDGHVRENKVSAPVLARGSPFNVVTGVRESAAIQLGDISLDLDKSCLFSLNYAIYELDHSKRENFAFLAFQIWVFIISSFGVLGESIPHIFASLATHAMVLGWGIFQVIQSVGFEANFTRIITKGACAGANLLPDLFDIRRRTDVALVVVNFVAFVFSCFLTLRLVRLVNWRNFKTVGANLAMNRHRKIMLVLFITIQLSFFFVVVFSVLIFDLLLVGNLKTSSSYPIFYKASSGSTIVLLIPWMFTGVYAVKNEAKVPMFFFLGCGVIWIIGFGSMFFATSFREEFTRWPFFATMGVMSILLTGISVVLGFACRFNFGKGYLIAKEIQSDTPVDPRAKAWDLESSPHTQDKISFPSPLSSNIPQFPVTFGQQNSPIAAPPPFFTPKQAQAPRFFGSRANSTKQSPGFNLYDSGSTKPPSYNNRDSVDSFGNVGAFPSPPSARLEPVVQGTTYLAPRSAPIAPPREVRDSEVKAQGDLARMFTHQSVTHSMYTDNGAGLERDDSWGSFGPGTQQQAPQTRMAPQPAWNTGNAI